MKTADWLGCLTAVLFLCSTAAIAAANEKSGADKIGSGNGAHRSLISQE
jgi:hypothetical protein